MDDEGKLKPKLLIPDEPAESMQLSDSLTELVCQARARGVGEQAAGRRSAQPGGVCRRAVRAAGQRAASDLGAMHAYLDRGRFRQVDFDFAISLANIVAVALVRARQQSTLATDYRRLVFKTAGNDELIGESRGIEELRIRIGRDRASARVRADPRRERLGQRAGRAGGSPRQPPRRSPDAVGQLRRDPARADGESALRP